MSLEDTNNVQNLLSTQRFMNRDHLDRQSSAKSEHPEIQQNRFEHPEIQTPSQFRTQQTAGNVPCDIESTFEEEQQTAGNVL